MKLYKKSEETGRNIILLVIIFLLVFAIMAYIIWQMRPVMYAYIDKIFG